MVKMMTMCLTKGDIFMEWKTKPNSCLWIQGKGPLLSFISSQTLIALNHYSGFEEEHSMVCYHLPPLQLRNLFSQLNV